MPPRTLKEYSKEEVQKHNNENDCWIIFDNGVYDVTKFLERHQEERKFY